MEEKVSKAIGKVEDQTNSFVLFCSVRGVDLSNLLVEFASKLEPKEEFKGFTFDEWHRLVGMVSSKIIELQDGVERMGKSIDDARQLYPSVHILADKLTRCMSRAVANGKSA